MLLSCLTLGGSALAQEYECPKADHKARPEQVFAARIDAMQRGDMQAIACSYAEDAVVIFPGSVVRGRTEIMKAFLAFASAFGGGPPNVTSITRSEDVLFVTYTLVTPGVSVPDGSVPPSSRVVPTSGSRQRPRRSPMR